MEYALSVRNLTKHYKNFTLRDVSFDLPCGSILGLIGDNGAGKTTTIKAILNLIRRDAGEITVLGMDNITGERRIKEQIGVAFDEFCWSDTLRAGDVGRVLSRIYPTWDQAMFSRLIQRCGLAPGQLLKEYSRGMKMKLSLAAALAHHPRLLLLDEATGGLDPVVRSEMLDSFLEFIQDERRAVLISSHITSDLEKICDYICYIHAGRVLLCERKDLLLERCGVLRCGAKEFAGVDRHDILRQRRGGFGCEALVGDRARAARRYPGAVVDPATLEDIMVFYAKGEPA
jgi:ABC-2 type transport system ATP-binding protein